MWHSLTKEQSAHAPYDERFASLFVKRRSFRTLIEALRRPREGRPEISRGRAHESLARQRRQLLQRRSKYRARQPRPSGSTLRDVAADTLQRNSPAEALGVGRDAHPREAHRHSSRSAPVVQDSRTISSIVPLQISRTMGCRRDQGSSGVRCRSPGHPSRGDMNALGKIGNRGRLPASGGSSRAAQLRSVLLPELLDEPVQNLKSCLRHASVARPPPHRS